MNPSELPRPFAFQTTPAPWPVHPPRRRAEKSNLSHFWPHSLAARPGAWPVHSPCVPREGFARRGAFGSCLGGLALDHWSFRAWRSPLTHPRHRQPVSTR
jgi:hypothetical protein